MKTEKKWMFELSYISFLVDVEEAQNPEVMQGSLSLSQNRDATSAVVARFLLRKLEKYSWCRLFLPTFIPPLPNIACSNLRPTSSSNLKRKKGKQKRECTQNKVSSTDSKSNLNIHRILSLINVSKRSQHLAAFSSCLDFLLWAFPKD